MRCRFLKIVFLAVACFAGAGVPAGVDSFVPPFIQGDGRIALYNVHLRETVEVEYRKGGHTYVEEALEEIDHLLRCRGDQTEAEMALPLIELVDHLQDHFGAGVVQVVSGYRSPSFNASLRRRGRRVAKYSRHMLGEAMDIRLPGVSMRRVRDYLVSLRAGGVGYYGAGRFVHVDVGPFRTW